MDKNKIGKYQNKIGASNPFLGKYRITKVSALETRLILELNKITFIKIINT